MPRQQRPQKQLAAASANDLAMQQQLRGTLAEEHKADTHQDGLDGPESCQCTSSAMSHVLEARLVRATRQFH
jgi:hypothetical protein